MQYDNLRNKIMVITGASSGFGRGVALQFSEKGATVVLAARRGEIIESLARECEMKGGRALAIPTDVSKRADMEHLLTETISHFGRIDVWFNNAGVGAIGRFTDIPLEEHVQVINTNLMGTLYGSYFAWEQFQKQRSGTLINMASALGKIPAPYYASYTASKHAVVGLSDGLRQELSESRMPDVHVCTIMPMSMDTFFFDHAANYTGHEVRPIPPLYDPEKVIDAVADLVRQPRDEVIVGMTGKAMNALHHMAPGLVEKTMEKEVQTVQYDRARAAPPTPGSVREPTPEGAEVRAGRLRKRGR